MIEGGDGPVEELTGIVIDNGQLRHGALRIDNALFILLLCQVQQSLGVVADPLQIGECLEDMVHILGIPVGHLLDIELDQKIADGVGQIVDDGFVFFDLLGIRHSSGEQSACGQVQIGADQARHALHLIADLQQGDAGRAHQVHVDVLQAAGILMLLLGHQQIGELDHLIGQGQQHRSGDDLEDDMDHRHLEHGVRHKGLHPLRIGQREGDNGHDHRTHQVVDQIDHGGPLGVIPGIHGSQNGGHGRANVNAANQERCKVQRHKALHGQCLQNTNSRGGGLDHGTQRRAYQNAQDWVLGIHNEVLEPGHILQGAHGGGHGMQALEQETETQDDLANVLVLLLLGVEH